MCISNTRLVLHKKRKYTELYICCNSNHKKVKNIMLKKGILCLTVYNFKESRLKKVDFYRF